MRNGWEAEREDEERDGATEGMLRLERDRNVGMDAKGIEEELG